MLIILLTQIYIFFWTTFLILLLFLTHSCYDWLTETLRDFKHLKLSIPRLLETWHFRGCRDRDQATLSKSCRDWDFFESLADPCKRKLLCHYQYDKNKTIGYYSGFCSSLRDQNWANGSNFRKMYQIMAFVCFNFRF